LRLKIFSPLLSNFIVAKQAYDRNTNGKSSYINYTHLITDILHTEKRLCAVDWCET